MCNSFTRWVLVHPPLTRSLWNRLCMHENGYVGIALQLVVAWFHHAQHVSDTHSWQTHYACATCWVWADEKQNVIDQIPSHPADALLSIVSRCIDTVEDINKYYEIVFQSRLIEKVLGFLICQHSCQNPLLSRFWIVSLFSMSSNDHSGRRKTQWYLKWYMSVAIEGNIRHGFRPRVSSSEFSWYQAY